MGDGDVEGSKWVTESGASSPDPSSAEKDQAPAAARRFDPSRYRPASSLPIVLIVLLSVLPSVAALALRLLDVDGGWILSGEFQNPMVHALLSWSAAILGLAAGLFAYMRWRILSGAELETVALALALPTVAALDAFHALVPELVPTEQMELALAITWNASRWFLAVTLVGGVVTAWVTATSPLRLRWGGVVRLTVFCVLFLAAGALAMDLSFDGDSVSSLRLWELGPLLVLVLGAGLWMPALLTERRHGLNEGLYFAFVPLILCQLEMTLGSIFIGHWQQSLAYGALLAGALVEYGRAQKGQDGVRQERDVAAEELRSKTAELARIDLQRMVQEEKHREAEEQRRMLAKAVETMSLGVTITDMNSKIIYVNPADARAHGYTVAELLGQDSRIYSAGEGTRRKGADGEPWARERINRTKSGEIFPVRLVSDRVFNESGAPTATVTICEDIRERIRIREALERRDRILEAVAFAAEQFLYESTWEASVGGVLARLGEATVVQRVYLDLINEAYPFGVDDIAFSWCKEGEDDGRHLDLEDSWEAVLRAGEVLSVGVQDLPEQDRLDLHQRGVAAFVLVPLFVRSQWQGFLCFEAATTREWSHAELEALKTAARTFGVAIQRRQDEETLAASESKYRELLESANDLVQSVSPDGRFQFVNRAWKEALGYSAEELKELTIWDVVKPTQSEPGRDVLQSMMIDDGLGRFEAVFASKHGDEIAVEGVVTCRYQDGLPVAAQGIFRDITERRMIDRMKQEFISTVSHELRTPLTSIIASLGLLNSGRLADKPERFQELLSVAHRNSTRLLKLINNLLDLQKLAARKMTFREDPIAADSILEEAVAGIQAFADQCHVGLQIGHMEPDLEMIGDRDRMIQVLNNLLSNAIKFSPAEEMVTVAALSREDRVVITVSDNGPGIPEEFQSRLFDQFTQADPSKTRASGGSGLGLSIAKGLVEGMGGQISLDTRIGSGTTFFVELPAAVDVDEEEGEEGEADEETGAELGESTGSQVAPARGRVSTVDPNEDETIISMRRRPLDSTGSG